MITILGAGGTIANELVKRLAARKNALRLVGRSAHPLAGAPGAAEILTADVTDQEQTIRAVAGSQLVYLLVGLKYDHKIWAELWPRVIANTIEACKRAGAKLIFFDDVYMYGRVDGPMTEETPFNPCSKKGEVRARVARTLIEAWQSGSITAMIARCADFYGPGARMGVGNVMVFDMLARGKKAMWFANRDLPHSLTYTPDAAESLVNLAETDSAWNQTWHVPTAPNPPTAKEFVAMAAKEFRAEPKCRVVWPLTMRLVGLINPVVGEMREMVYQYDSPYIFDSSKYAKALGFAGTPYAEGIRATAEAVKRETVKLKR
ncbi:MAG: NAD-dependent epimerase/dehydratase family protein [Candidatus Acidiferrales bacterium]